MKKRILTLVLALVMILPLVIACTPTDEPKETEKETQAATDAPGTGGVEQPTTAPEDTGPETDEYGRPAFSTDYLNLETKFNETITFLAWDDHTMQEFEGTGDKGEEIDTAIYRRNEAVTRKLGVDLVFIDQPASSSDEQAEFQKKVEADFADGGKAQYDIYAAYSRLLPVLAVNGYTQDLNKLEYLNFEADWWLDTLVSECSIAGELHFVSGDISTNLLWMTMAIFFSKSLLDEYNIEYPYELVKEGKWTFEAFKQLISGVWEDADGSGGVTVGDTVGFTANNTGMDVFGAASGFRTVDFDDKGYMKINDDFYGEEMLKCLEFLNELVFRDNGFYYNDDDARDIFFAEQALFTSDRFFIAAGKDSDDASGSIQFDFGVLPAPMWQESQGRYYSQVGHPFSMYGISKKTTLANESAAVLELMEAEGYRYVTPAVFYTAMKIRYSDDPDASEMYDTIRETITYEAGRYWCNVIGTTASSAFRKGFLASSVSATAWKKEVGNIKKKILEVNTFWGYTE